MTMMMMIMMMTKMKMITMMMMMMGKMILTKYAGNNFLGKKPFGGICLDGWWCLSSCWCLGGLSIVGVSVVSQLCFASWWHFGGVSVSLDGVRWCFGSCSCYHGVSVVSWRCSRGVVVVSKKLYFLGQFCTQVPLHTDARRKNYTYTLLHAETPNTNWPQDIAFWLQFWTMGTRFIWERFFRHKFSRNKLQFHFDLSWSTRVSCGDRSQRTGRIAISPQFVHDQHVFRARKVHCAPAQSHFDHSFCWSMRVSCGKGAPTELQSYIYFSVWRFTRVSRERDAFCKDRFALRCCL